MPATKAAMNPDPWSPLAIPWESAAPAAGIACHHASAIRSRRPACLTMRAMSRPATTPPEHAEADLLQQQDGGAAAARDLRFDVGNRDRREQQRHADSVVE